MSWITAKTGIRVQHLALGLQMTVSSSIGAVCCAACHCQNLQLQSHFNCPSFVFVHAVLILIITPKVYHFFEGHLNWALVRLHGSRPTHA